MVLVAGLVNMETSVRIDSFPIEYQPITYPLFSVNTAVSGVGYNIAKAIKTLGSDVRLYSLAADDEAGETIRGQLQNFNIDSCIEQGKLKETATSAVLFDKEGRRRIYCDLKNIQSCKHPSMPSADEWKNSDAAIICNINFARPFLKQAKKYGVPIVTDMHVFSDVHDEYDKEWLENANVVFLSDEGLPCEAKDFLKEIAAAYPGIELIILGMGAKGLLLYNCKSSKFIRQKAVRTVKVVNTVGAGDALLSAFTYYYYSRHLGIEEALRHAQIFASIKIGTSGGAQGFVNHEEVERWAKR